MKSYLNTFQMLAICMVVGICMTFAACGDDDDNGDNSETVSPIVGVWIESISNSRLTLSADGTFDYFVESSVVTGKGTYSYDDATRTLALYYDPKNTFWGDQVWLVLTLDTSHLVVMNTYNDDTYMFTKKQ